MAGGAGSKGETEAMVDDVANNLKNITTLIPDLQRHSTSKSALMLSWSASAMPPRSRPTGPPRTRAAETKEKQAEGEADAQKKSRSSRRS